MVKNKTSETEQEISDFLDAFVDTPQKRLDSEELIRRMKAVSGCEPKMWGPSIIGFGSYHYIYASGHEGDAPLIGFSPRKTAISLYVYIGLEEHQHLIAKLGKIKMGKACIYVKKLTDIDMNALDELMQTTMEFIKMKYK